MIWERAVFKPFPLGAIQPRACIQRRWKFSVMWGFQPRDCGVNPGMSLLKQIRLTWTS